MIDQQEQPFDEWLEDSLRLKVWGSDRSRRALREIRRLQNDIVGWGIYMQDLEAENARLRERMSEYRERAEVAYVQAAYERGERDKPPGDR